MHIHSRLEFFAQHRPHNSRVGYRWSVAFDEAPSRRPCKQDQQIVQPVVAVGTAMPGMMHCPCGCRPPTQAALTRAAHVAPAVLRSIRSAASSGNSRAGTRASHACGSGTSPAAPDSRRVSATRSTRRRTHVCGAAPAADAQVCYSELVTCVAAIHSRRRKEASRPWSGQAVHAPRIHIVLHCDEQCRRRITKLFRTDLV